MKKVRFETSTKIGVNMNEYECQSPRPFLERQIINIDSNFNNCRPVVFTTEPVHRFENDNSLPYPTANKTSLAVVRELENKNVPSSDLDLSMLDYSKPVDRISPQNENAVFRKEPFRIVPVTKNAPQTVASHRILTSVENTPGLNQPNIKDNEFFLKRENLGTISFNSMHQQFDRFGINNQYNPVGKKNELIKIGTNRLSEKENYAPARVNFNTDCNCHHCIKTVRHAPCKVTQDGIKDTAHIHRHIPRINYNINSCVANTTKCSCNCNMPIIQPVCSCCSPHPPLSPENAIDKKTWAIEKYEKTREGESSQVEKSNNVSKEKREPTVSDLFKIIKMQNEQLQLLQEKVDKFISTHNNELHEKQKVQNYVTEQLAVQTVNSEQHKISIGVMTSFEMVRTSTVINKEIVKQCEAQIQCNRSQISIKEVVSKKQAGNLNFLEGISPVSKAMSQMKEGNAALNFNNNESCQGDNIIEDKTLNELSLYNVQVDNATTPLMSPEQSLYLDIRDYSESDSGSDDQSNVGWTYYNKVMTHVNGMLQDSDMPSSASALYRQTKQKFTQIDKSNVSVAKRVTFGDDPLGVQQHIASPTDTSLKMDQLAAKYLKHTPASHTPSPKATGEMSFATRKYMERHNLLQGQNASTRQDIPRFLDITALKQQPKFI